MNDNQQYAAPVARLLTLGDARPTLRAWPDYREMGLTAAEIPELIRMMTDAELLWAPSDSDIVWAPMHAWRALGELHAEAGIPSLLATLIELESDDWAGEELPDVFALIGPAAIPALRDFLADRAQHLWPRITVSTALTRMAALHPQVRDRIIDLLSRQLSQFRAEDPTINAFLISALIDLQATRALSLIKLAFDAQKVDISVYGGWEVVKARILPAGDVEANGQDSQSLLMRVDYLRRYLAGTDEEASPE